MSEAEKLQLSLLALIAHGIGHQISLTNMLLLKSIGGQNEDVAANLQQQAPILRKWHTELYRLAQLVWASDSASFDPKDQGGEDSH